MRRQERSGENENRFERESRHNQSRYGQNLTRNQNMGSPDHYDRDLADYNRQLHNSIRSKEGYNRYGYETREPDQRYGVAGRSWGEDTEGRRDARSSRDFDSGNRDRDRNFEQSRGNEHYLGSSYEGEFGREREHTSYERPGRDGQRGFHFGRQFENERHTGMTDYSGTGDGEYRAMSGQHRGKGPKNFTRSDERIREDVCQRLMDAEDVDAQDIDVRVEAGTVTLEGTVDSRATKRRAEDLIESVSGVLEIENRLRLSKDNFSSTSTKSASQKSGSKSSTSTQSLN